MIRSTAIIFAIFCVATVLSEAFGLAVLWYRGQLSPETIKDIRLALVGDDDLKRAAEEDGQNRLPTVQEVMQRRSLAVLELNTRQVELGLLKRMIETKKSELTSQTDDFKQMKSAFDLQLVQMEEQLASVATEQARGILKALQPADAAENLMQLPLEEDVLLLKGMAEKEIARILEALSKGEQEQRERGRQIFEALSRGEPHKTLTEDLKAQFNPQAPPPQS